jgi:hypothetical protein
MKKATLSVLVLGLMSALALPVFADTTLYNDTTVASYQGNGISISSSSNNAATDSFQLTSSATVTSISLGVLFAKGDSLAGITWAITSTPSPAITGTGSGYSTPLKSGTATVFSSIQESAVSGYLDDLVSFSIPALALNAGTAYWLEIDQIATTNSKVGEWDESVVGASTAYYEKGLAPSETFQILGTENTATTPEPSSFLLLGSGLAGLAGLIKRKFVA